MIHLRRFVNSVSGRAVLQRTVSHLYTGPLLLFSLPLRGGGIPGEGREAEGFSLSKATDEAEAFNLIINDRIDEALQFPPPSGRGRGRALRWCPFLKCPRTILAFARISDGKAAAPKGLSARMTCSRRRRGKS